MRLKTYWIPRKIRFVNWKIGQQKISKLNHRKEKKQEIQKKKSIRNHKKIYLGTIFNTRNLTSQI